MNQSYKHHYLPIFYLRQWAAVDGKIVRYYRPASNRAVVISRNSPKETGYERDLYGLEGRTPKERNSIETGFMSPIVDSPAAPILKALKEEDNPIPALTSEHRRAWTRFVMSLLVRTPGKVKFITEQATDELQNSLLADPGKYEALREADDPPTLFEWAKQNAPEQTMNFGKQLLPIIIAHEQTSDEIMRMYWRVEAFPENSPDLITCDRPVYMSHGVMDEGCFIALPLSPRRLFIATRTQTATERVLSHGPKAVAKSLNDLLASQADKHIYSAHGNLLRFVEKRLK